MTDYQDNDIPPIYIANEICGEVGEPLHPDIVRLIRDRALKGFWPLAFGENDGEMTELHFCYEPEHSVSQAEFFITQNGAD